MARLTDKVQMEFQKKYTLEEVEGGDITLVSVEKKAAETSKPYYLCRFKKGKDTGYFATSLPSLMEYFDKVKKEFLPAEIKLAQVNGRWIIE